MPRQPRNEEAGAIYHVFSRGVNRARTFVDDEDYERYTSLLGETIRRYRWNCLAYCLMPNHVHLLIETPEPTLSAGMQWLQGFYAQLFNKRHHRVGHLFQNRFKHERIKDEAQLVTVVGYIALNPVAAVLCHRPEDWRRSSHRSVAEGRPPTWLAHRRLLDLLEAISGSRCYEDLIETRFRLTTDTTLK